MNRKLEFEIDGVEYEIPPFINTETYVKIFKIKDILTDEYFSAKLINIVTGCPIDTVLQTNYDHVQFIANYILSLIPRVENNFKDKFELNGVKYGFVPKWNTMGFAEYVDIDTLSSKPYEEMLDYLHILGAMFYRPIIEERNEHDFDIEPYDSKTVEKRAEIFKKKLDVGIILGGQFFFMNSVKKSSEVTPQYSISNMSLWEQIKHVWKFRKVINVMLKQPLSNDLVGTLYSTNYQKMILQNTIRSYRSPWWKRLTKRLTWSPWTKKRKKDTEK